MLLDFDKLGGLRAVLIALIVLVCLFLILPIVFIAALSFGSSQWLIFPPPAWTLKWYQDLFADPRWLYSALTSLKIAAIVTVLSVAIGFLAALGLDRGRFPGRDLLRALFLTPMILPVVVLAVALLAGAPLGGTLTFLLTVGTGGFLVAYLLVCLAAPVFLRRIGELTWPAVAATAVIVPILVAVLVAFVARSGGTPVVVVLAALAVAGACWFGWLRLRRPDRIAGIGVYDETVADDVLGADVVGAGVPGGGDGPGTGGPGTGGPGTDGPGTGGSRGPDARPDRAA